jgi:hypothetical protein
MSERFAGERRHLLHDFRENSGTKVSAYSLAEQIQPRRALFSASE